MAEIDDLIRDYKKDVKKHLESKAKKEHLEDYSEKEVEEFVQNMLSESGIRDLVDKHERREILKKVTQYAIHLRNDIVSKQKMKKNTQNEGKLKKSWREKSFFRGTRRGHHNRNNNSTKKNKNNNNNKNHGNNNNNMGNLANMLKGAHI